MPSQPFPHHQPHHHHHHHHCFPPPQRYHHHHHLFTNFVPNVAPCPCLLHHNHHHHHHHHLLHFLPIDPHIIAPILPNPCLVPAGFSSGYPTVSTAAGALVSESGVQPQDLSEDLVLEDPGEEGDLLEDVFVLTDEWRDFFAKSEAKRRMDKQQKNKHRKKGYNAR